MNTDFVCPNCEGPVSPHEGVISYSYAARELYRCQNKECGIFSSKEEIIEMLFGNYLREEKLHERVLAKLTKNIANEMGVNV